ncbi:late competence protein ComER [Falsibacillus albus]|uniref:Late competence protein ComER n=1 Tax=Falsibacillus albus TaxID=2478915 RepID=A0A3L7K6D3_9BACI|nr:late competence protein ComER [Falsibacillus albus]RLQ98155.1 late competence protein ComER [Falsibacillus albus]
MKIGMIGTGNMGSILTEAFIEGKAISPSAIIATNRTLEKAQRLQKKFNELQVTASIAETIKNADLIFICVKPHDIYPLLDKYSSSFSEEKCLVSITSPVSVGQLESKVNCSCVRAIPSITNRALAGVSLITYGNKCEGRWKEYIFNLFSFISKPIIIEDNITRVSSDIVSCGPAFFSYLTQRFIDGAVNETEIDRETATTLAGEMLVGLGELLKKGFYTLPTLQEKVCVKGGITGEGIKILEYGIDDVFEKLFQATHDKFKEDLERVYNQFGN